MAGKRITVLACESQPVLIEGLRCTLADFEDFEFLGAVSSPSNAPAAVSLRRPDVLLVDHEDGAAACIALLSQLRNAAVATNPVLWIRRMEEPDRIRSLELGARGIIRKDRPIPLLVDCLHTAASGRFWIDEALPGDAARPEVRKTPYLTPRELQILSLIARGMKNSQIAHALAISPGTVKVHLMHVFEKTGSIDRFDLAMRSRRLLSAHGQA